jgi:hypothetical protein
MERAQAEGVSDTRFGLMVEALPGAVRDELAEGDGQGHQLGLRQQGLLRPVGQGVELGKGEGR